MTLSLLLHGPLQAQRPVATDSTPPRRDTLDLPSLEVVGGTERLRLIPGAGHVLEEAELRQARVFTTNEALRKLPGVHVRDEEGFGLRPNIGIRGLNPTRSTKVLLLEDGIPFTLAPYGDNASYYHPPIDRFERLELLTGSGQILFGPSTIGGVINYVTPAPTRDWRATAIVTPGTRDYLNVHARGSGSAGAMGLLVDAVRKQGAGARENVGTTLTDLSLKAVADLGAGHALTARGNWYRERSQVTYSGLTEAEFAADPLANPFVNDSMFLDRVGASLTHRWRAGAVQVTTNAYVQHVDRPWWRQSSNSSQRPNDRSDPSCAGMANLTTTCGNEGRIRRYDIIGIEPRARVELVGRRVAQVVETGLRAHYEWQDRRQENGQFPNSRSASTAGDPNGGVREINRRRTQAYAAFVQNRITAGRLSVTPGLRVEHIRLQRENLLALPAVAGRTDLTVVVPGVGFTLDLDSRLALFGGVHRGFAPPRPEDVISNTTGGVIELDPELSWNSELGVRTQPWPGISVDATLFNLDFQNQIVPASVAGGVGATLTSAGQTIHRGAELAVALDAAEWLRVDHGPYLRAAWTKLPVARYAGDRFAYVGTGNGDVVGKVYDGQNASETRTRVNVRGHRLPYAPRELLTATVGYGWRRQVDLRLEGVFVGRQFADPLNTAVLVPDGQQGPIDPSLILNVAASYDLPRTGTGLFVTVKNALDARYVVDRSRGLMPGMPRLVQGGVSQRF